MAFSLLFKIAAGILVLMPIGHTQAALNLVHPGLDPLGASQQQQQRLILPSKRVLHYFSYVFPPYRVCTPPVLADHVSTALPKMCKLRGYPRRA